MPRLRVTGSQPGLHLLDANGQSVHAQAQCY
jgi:hypothetical protein